MAAKNPKVEKLALEHSIINAFDHNSVANTKAVLGKIIQDVPEVKSNIKETIEIINKVVSNVNSWSTEKLKDEYEKLGIKPEKKKDDGGLRPLDNAKIGKVVMRMAPYPSGPLHIGNARMVILNDEYVKKYNGKLMLVYDDTIGSKEKGIVPNGYELVKEGIDWLGVKVDKEFYKSDRIEIYYKYAEELMKKNLAYVCLCSADELRSNRKIGKACKHRKQNVDENLTLWKKMLEGEFKEGEAVVRLKTDIKHPNPAFRDRVLMRLSYKKHPRVDNKYHVWPMLELSWAVDDHELGMTHILRGKDLMIEDMMESFIWEKLGWEKAEFIHHGMLRIEESKLSKSQARAAIESGVLKGWDDPRTWSLQSLRRRGIRPESVRNFIKHMGVSLADVNVPAEILYAENRKIVDKEASRYFAVLHPVKISVNNDSVKFSESPIHPEFPKRGKRKIPVDCSEIYVEEADYEKHKNKEVGLMNLFSIILNKKAKFKSEDVKMESPKMHWISKDNIKVTIVMPNGEKVKALAEPEIKKAKKDDIIQLVRVGFCRVDVPKKDIVLYFAHK